MAIAVEHASIGTPVAQSASSTTVAFTTDQTVAAGGFVVLCVGFFGDDNDVLNGVAGGGLTWVIDQQGHAGTNVRGVAIVSAQAPSGVASSTAITATFNQATTARTIGGTSFTGVATSSPVDGTPTTPTASAVAAWATPSYTIADGSLIVATCWNENTASGNTPTSPAVDAWEAIDGSGPYQSVCSYRIEATGGGFTVAGTWGAAQPSTNIAVAYLAAAGVAVQTLRPDADIATTGWATAPLWSKIEEESADGTVITATAS